MAAMIAENPHSGPMQERAILVRAKAEREIIANRVQSWSASKLLI